MFSALSVFSRGYHVTITHDALELTTEGPPALPTPPPDMWTSLISETLLPWLNPFSTGPH